ncbi:23283_t:CDS:2, partial [Gigaspora rosea]
SISTCYLILLFYVQCAPSSHIGVVTRLTIVISTLLPAVNSSIAAALAAVLSPLH